MRSGILNIYKPAKIGSTAVVNRLKRMIPRGIKIGHAGTLDPFATGVLLVLIGREATRLCERMMDKSKQYVATVRLGATTPTDDPESEPFLTPGVLPVSPESVAVAISRQIGVVLQRPPAYSALKIAGQRASDRIRGGESIALEPRTVRIDSIELLDYAWPDVRIRVDCGRGTYIRSIARDLGESLGVGGYLVQLERTRVGAFGIEDAINPEGLTPANIENHIIPVDALSFPASADS
jgi:tRNA pseudouridine55 synthase